MSSDHFCCRSQFIEGQWLHEAESKTLEYKNYIFPYDTERQFQLLRVICGMLNTEGGIVLIGIKQTTDRKRIVMPSVYSEDDKEKVLIYFRKLSETIYPDNIVTNELLEIDFVPITSGDKKSFIKGGFILRLKIKKGDRKQIYFFSMKNQDHYYFRTKNQTIRKGAKDVFALFKNRILSTQQKQSQSILHKSKCIKPHIGAPLYSNNTIKQPFPGQLVKNEKNQRPKSSGKWKNVYKNQQDDDYGKNWNTRKPNYNPNTATLDRLKNKNEKAFKNKSQQQCVFVLINISNEQDIQKLLPKSGESGFVISEHCEIIVIFIYKKDLAEFKSSFNSYLKTVNPKALNIQATKNISFKKVQMDDSLISNFVIQYCKMNPTIKGVEYYPQDRVMTFPDALTSAKIFMQLSQKGIRPRFEN